MRSRSKSAGPCASCHSAADASLQAGRDGVLQRENRIIGGLELISVFSAFFWVSVCVYQEARGEEEKGQIAVAQVILNRANQRRETVKEVITASKQFSWYNGKKTPPIDNYDAFIGCMKATAEAMLERLSGNTMKGANLYYNPHLADPYWAHSPRVKIIAEIGNHIFMRE